LKIIFAGTPAFAATHLQSIIDQGQHEVIAVYTQPDRPAGRGKKLTASAVKLLAEQYNLPLFQPESLKAPDQQQLLSQHNADLMVVVAYGLLLPQAVLDIPKLGCINVHASLLPRWRGAAPIQRAIEAGDSETGVSIMQMEAGLDTGPVISTAHCDIEANDTSVTLFEKLADLGGPALLSALSKIESGTAVASAQDEQQSTYAHKIDKSEALINWSDSATSIARKIRAFNPFPVAYTQIDDLRIKVWTAQVVESPAVGEPGTVLDSSSEGLVVQCGSGHLLVSEIQLPGKSRMAVSEILKSRADQFSTGSRFA
jgi:methionyl-tRNA formyltransferase